MGYIAFYTHTIKCFGGGGGNDWWFQTTGSHYYYFDSFGSYHYFNTGTLGTCNGPTDATVLANDGSGYTIQADPGGGSILESTGETIYPPVQIGAGAGSFTDRNGNKITADSAGHFTDTLGTIALSISGAAPNPQNFTYTAPSGANASVAVSYVTYTVKTNFGCSGVSDYGPTSISLVDKVTLPDNTFYQFAYEPTPGNSGDVTGRIASVTLPTLGKITYTYTGGSSGHITCSDGSASGLTRQVYDGTNTNTWTYTRVMGTGAASETTVTAPKLSYDSAANQTIIQFQGIYETQRDAYQGSGPTITSLPISESTLQTPGLLQEIQTVGSTGPRTVTTILPGSANLQSQVVSSYNSYGQLTEEDDYDFGRGAPGALLRKKLITIQTVGTYQAIQTAQIQDGSGNVLRQTQMTFDEPGHLTSTSGTPQHTNPTVGRGNPTTISDLVQGSTSLTETLTYFDTGNVGSIKDVNTATTTYNYADSTSTCGNSFPTSVTEPISGLSQSMVWNCTGGVATSATDENLKVVSTGYTDTQFWRPHSTTDQLSNVTTVTYGGQTSAESSMPFNGTTSTSDNLVTLDGLGRSHISQTKQSPSSTSYDSVETDYDVVGRPYRTTTPYSASAGQTTSPTAPATTTTYDALGRVLTLTDAGSGTVTYSYSQNDVYQTLGPAPSGENAKRKQMEYDGLGRLTSVCEITNLTGSGTCAQTSSVTGYWTKYTYDANGNLTAVTQNAQAASGQQQTRGYTYDDLSRMTSETDPETGGTSGTTPVYYTYDSDAACGTYKGDMVKAVDAIGNTTCHAYDALHRNTSTTYSGPYAAVTPNEYFVYDTASVNTFAMANAKTRLAEAYTAACSTCSKVTDVGLSYTARGETSDVYESTLHSGGYYHVPATYWANGALNQLNNASCSGQPCFPGLTTFTYGADGEGRTNTVNAASGQNPVTGTTYNLYTSPPQTTVSFGSGDSDVFNSDANTGRMTQYKFNVGSQSVVGNLTWNPNGTLVHLGITDPFNSSNAQSCTYSHDDMIRIASANCGSIWSQTFSFDPFGNINKAGTSSFGATYSPATNRMTTIGTSTPSYDANGNVTNDFLHTYAWDANDRPVTIDGIGATYDALGRLVELNRSGAYAEIVYTPSGGKLALMNGQSLLRAFVPLPGGATAVYTSSGLDHYRHSDWLGSARLETTPGQTVYGDVAYAPYGETYAASGNNDYSWTGINADVEPANPETLYDFPAREYGIQGRWPSPDPLGLGAVDPSDPQSWNRYAYVWNNPLAVTDPTGMEGGGPCVPCIVFDIFFGLFSFFGGHHHHAIPHAPSAPPGGYGGGIDPFGCLWCETSTPIPQIGGGGLPGLGGLGIPGIPGGSRCDFVVCGITAYQEEEVFNPWVWAGVRAAFREVVYVLWPIILAKGGASQNPLPSWVTDRPLIGETAEEFARRVCQARYPPDGAGCGEGAGSEFNKIRKWAQDWINKQKK